MMLWLFLLLTTVVWSILSHTTMPVIPAVIAGVVVSAFLTVAVWSFKARVGDDH